MDKKVKSCFTSHIVMHSFFGLGLGMLLSVLVPSLRIIWLGPILMVGAVVADSMRKK